MNKKTLHIISLDIPYPPDKGSVIGIYNRIKALHYVGVDVILHAFYKEFSLPTKLAEYCKSIYLIPRKKIWQAVDAKWPLYVQSRRSEGMVLKLLEDDHPILFEGLHTMYHFDDPRLENRNKSVRMHNIESHYYAHLAKIHSDPLKKLYYSYESSKSSQIESDLLPKADVVFSINAKDDDYLNSLQIKSTCILPFIDTSIEIKSGVGEYALYHGDLSIKENEKAALYLIEQVFNELDYPLYIAGKNPNNSLINKVKNNLKIKLINSPTINEMESLIRNAQMILAPFSQTTGYKMKLLESMRMGRHIITSDNCREYSEIATVLNLASNPDEWKKYIKKLSTTPLSQEIIQLRKEIIQTYFNPEKNVMTMIDNIF